MTRSLRLSVLATATMACLIVGTIAVARAQGGYGGGGRGRGGWGGDPAAFEAARDRMDAMRSLDLAPMWAVLSFESGADATALEPLRIAFSDAWKTRESVLADAATSDKIDWDGIKREFGDTKKKLDDRIKSTLSADQFDRYTRGMEALAASMPRGGRGMRGG